jgi:hypothetical protein
MKPASNERVAPRLPRVLEADPIAARLHRLLADRARPLWSGSDTSIAELRLGPALEAALRHAHAEGRLVRGLESAARALDAEERGLRLADRRAAAPRGARVSRLLLLTSDGAERFYRQVEAQLRRHGARVLAVRLDADAARLGALLFGPERRARLVLLEHKDAVVAALRALASDVEAAA